MFDFLTLLVIRLAQLGLLVVVVDGNAPVELKAGVIGAIIGLGIVAKRYETSKR